MTTPGSDTLERSITPEDPSAERRPIVTRRTLLGGIASSVALAACSDLGPLTPLPAAPGGSEDPSAPESPSPSESASPSPSPSATPTAPPAPGPAPGAPVEPVLADDPALHLLRRTTFGPTAAMVAAVRDDGIEAYLDAQLAPDGIDDSACEQLLGRYPALGLTAQEIHDRPDDQGGMFVADRHLLQATVVRALCSERQLLEVMAEFWANHFSIFTPSDDDWGRRTVADREVYRAHALGRFADLLLASAKDPAMLRYLNNEQSCFTGDPDTVQENYGRELLELHTVGVNGGYDEDDVRNSAYIMTGWTVDDGKTFTFRADCHYVGEVTVMDFSAPNPSAEGGQEVGEAYLDYLAHHPSTASYLATKLARRFIADAPPEALVTTLAETYLENDTEIVPVLRALLTSDAFAESYGQKTRRPLEGVVATARALGLTVLPEPREDNPRTLLDVAYDLGQAPLNWAPPNGYPDTANIWLSSARLLGSWNYHWDLLEGRYDGWLTAAADALGALTTAQVATVGELVDALIERLLWQQMRDADRQAVIEFTGMAEDDQLAGADEADLRKRIVLAVLNSPYHLQR